MMKILAIFLLFMYLPCGAFAFSSLNPRSKSDFSIGEFHTFDDYLRVKNKVTNNITKNRIIDNNTLSDRCQNNGIHGEQYTLDRRCYLTDAQKRQSPYNAVVALFNPDDDNNIYCTGTIVKNPKDGKLYMYTAAHCVRDKTNIHVMLQNGNTMDLEPAYVGVGSKYKDVALYKIPKQFENDVPFVTTGDMHSGYFEIIGYGSLPIMNDKQIYEARKIYLETLRDFDIDPHDYKSWSVLDEFGGMLPDDNHLKGSFNCNFLEPTSEIQSPSIDKTYCQGYHGDSGAPIFDADGKIVALVHGGRAYFETDLYAEMEVDLQETISEAQDEFVIASRSRLRNEAGNCFKIINQKGKTVEEPNNNCKDIPIGGWNIMLGNGSEYNGLSKCMPTNNVFNKNDFNRTHTGHNGYCWCKTNGTTTGWEYHESMSANFCERFCTELCVEYFIRQETLLTDQKTDEQPDSKDGSDKPVIIAHDHDYCRENDKINSAACANLSIGAWAVTYKDNTKYTGISKCTSINTNFDDNDFNSQPTGNHCWCKLDGANAKWEKHKSLFSPYDKNYCVNNCATECAESFIKATK